jgi:hypothetical protein
MVLLDHTVPHPLAGQPVVILRQQRDDLGHQLPLASQTCTPPNPWRPSRSSTCSRRDLYTAPSRSDSRTFYSSSQRYPSHSFIHAKACTNAFLSTTCQRKMKLTSQTPPIEQSYLPVARNTNSRHTYARLLHQLLHTTLLLGIIQKYTAVLTRRI